MNNTKIDKLKEIVTPTGSTLDDLNIFLTEYKKIFQNGNYNEKYCNSIAFKHLLEAPQLQIADLLWRFSEKYTIHDFILALSDNNKTAIIDNNSELEILNYHTRDIWQILYTQKPPTIEEFLTSDWIGPTGLSIYDHVRETLQKFWSNDSKYRHLILAPCISWGKTLTSTLSALYIIVNLSLMKSPQKFFGLSPIQSISLGLVSFNLQKVEQLLLDPFTNILESAPVFERIMQEGALAKKQEENPDKLCWTTAGKVGSIQFPHNIHLVIASNRSHLLGLTLICSVMSEISHFIERGVSPQEIWEIYNESRGRVFSRFSNKYFATTILDSSPNDLELSPIDRFIFNGEAGLDKTNYVIKANHWETFPEKYPEYLKTKKTFKVYKGSGGKPAKIITSLVELKNFTKDEILAIPIDVKPHFINNIKKALRDYAGYPGGSSTKLFDDFECIEKMFNVQLNNVYGSIHAPAGESPEHLIWDQIKNEFFINFAGKYIFHRNPQEKRYIHCDLAESGDFAAIAIAHPEVREKTGEIVVVADMTIVISPSKNDRINLDAISCFIDDLHRLGRLPIEKVTFDQYQSSSLIQRLERLGYDVGRFSVDKEKNPYYVLASWIKNNRVKCGKNIFLKNNLKSLQEVVTQSGKTKIDHLVMSNIVLDDGGDWETSQMGYGMKDASDALCGAVNHVITEYRGVPGSQWMDVETEEEADELIIRNLDKKLRSEGYKSII